MVLKLHQNGPPPPIPIPGEVIFVCHEGYFWNTKGILPFWNTRGTFTIRNTWGALSLWGTRRTLPFVTAEVLKPVWIKPVWIKPIRRSRRALVARRLECEPDQVVLAYTRHCDMPEGQVESKVRQLERFLV